MKIECIQLIISMMNHRMYLVTNYVVLCSSPCMLMQLSLHVKKVFALPNAFRPICYEVYSCRKS